MKNQVASNGATHIVSRTLLATAGLVGLTLAGCGGGGSTTSDTPGGAIEPLSVADSMSVVTTNDGGSSATVAPHSQADTTGFAGNCDYNTDVANSHVYDPSMETLGTVNMILCLLKQTAYSGLLNEGPYKAQIDEASCDNGKSNSAENSQTGQSTGAQQAFNVWVVESSRDSNTAAQNVEFWIPNQGESGGQGNDGEIRVRVTITKGVSEENPFGVFDLNFIQFNSITDQVRGFGNLHTLDVSGGNVGFSFYQQQGDVTVAQQPDNQADLVAANVTMSADLLEGQARIMRTERSNYGSGGDSGPQTTQYELAFNATNVLRSTNGDAGTCLSRVDFSKRTWRYNLYDATTGNQVELNSGFGFQTQDGRYAWIGYYGLWAPPDVTLSNGDVVTRQEFGSSVAQTYTVVKAPGKLVKSTRHALALTQLTGQSFNWWYYVPQGGAPLRFHVVYQGGEWLGVESFNDQSQEFQPIEPPLLIPVQSIGFLGMYSDTLGGQVSYVFPDEFITYYSREFIGPSDDLFARSTTVDLYGYFQCLDAGISGETAQTGDVYLPNSFEVGQPHHYRFDKTTMTLSLIVGETSTPAGLADGETYSGGPNAWGMQSGPMVLSTQGFESTQQVWSQEVFFTYETGPNPWNQFATLLDDTNTAVVFDPPLQFSYTHTTGDDVNGDNTYNGRTYVLNYNGQGNLGGIPNAGIDFDGDGYPDRFFPLFSIKDGTLCGPTGTEYVLRAIDSESTLAEDPSGCTLLSTNSAASLELPTDEVWTDPAIGPVPEVLDAPRVIEGEIVGSIDG